MSYVMVDVESDGPAPGLYSLVSFGAVIVTPALDHTFYGQLRPISDAWVPAALAVSSVTREQHLGFEDPAPVMARFAAWIGAHGGKAHPAKPLLFLHAKGRLGLDDIRARCPNPDATRALAATLGVAAPDAWTG